MSIMICLGFCFKSWHLGEENIICFTLKVRKRKERQIKWQLTEREREMWVSGWFGKWMGGWMDGWMDGWVGGWMDGWVGGWMDGWMDGWMGEWMGGWTDIGENRLCC